MKKQLKNQNKILIGILVAASVLHVGGLSVSGQSISSAVTDRRAQLLRELEALEGEINGYQGLIGQKQSEAVTLERDISLLNNRIQQTRLQIRALDLTIESLQDKIGEKEGTINEIVKKVSREKLSLAEFLRTYQEHDETSLVETLITYNSVSDFLSEADSIDTIQESLQNSLAVLREIKGVEEEERNQLLERQEEQAQTRRAQALARKNLEDNQSAQKNILKETRGKESEYQKVLKNKQKSAASIRSELFLLQGSSAIKFEDAALFAERAEKTTGVRAGFVLGIIAQESELGRNIGQCNLPDDLPKHRWQAIMKPTRDIEPFKRITAELGLDPEKMPLSCPMSVGWGGAMGPAQFIPSTWELYKARIAAATGHNPPNPWNPEDAFMAAGIYLGDIGASTKAGEHTAAAKYFAGSGWKSAWAKTYANQVLQKVEKYQEQLNILKAAAATGN